MYRKLISHYWYFICRSLFEWKQFLGLYVYLFPTLLWSDSCLLGYLYIVSTIRRKAFILFARIFLFDSHDDSFDCEHNLWSTKLSDCLGRHNETFQLVGWAEATRGTYKLTSGKYGRGSDCWTICVDSTGVVALWPLQNSYWNIRTFLSLWPRQYRNCGLLLLAADDVKWLQHFSGGQFFRLCLCRKSITIKEAPLHTPQPHTTIRPEICCGWELNFWRKKLANWLYFLQRPQSTGHCLKSKQIESKETWWM